jgi:hypothetical protein
LTVHNYSSVSLTPTDISVLSKGLNFSPTPNYNTKDHLTLLKQFDQYADSVRFNTLKNKSPRTQLVLPDDTLTASCIHRRMKFLRYENLQIPTVPPIVEGYLHHTKVSLSEQVQTLFTNTSTNLTINERKSLFKLKKLKTLLLNQQTKILALSY